MKSYTEPILGLGTKFRVRVRLLNLMRKVKFKGVCLLVKINERGNCWSEFKIIIKFLTNERCNNAMNEKQDVKDKLKKPKERHKVCWKNKQHHVGNSEAHCCFIGRGGFWFKFFLNTSKKSFKFDIKRLGRLDVSWSQHMMVKNIIKLPWENCRPIVDPTTSYHALPWIV